MPGVVFMSLCYDDVTPHFLRMLILYLGVNAWCCLCELVLRRCHSTFLYARLETGRFMWLGMAGIHTGFCTITLVLYIGSWPNLATRLRCGRGRTLFILGSLSLYRLIIYIDWRILWCTHFLFKNANIIFRYKYLVLSLWACATAMSLHIF